MAQYFLDEDIHIHVWAGYDEASSNSYRISVTEEPIFTDHNHNDWSLEITCNREVMWYELQFSGVIARHHRDFIRQTLQNELGVPFNAVNDTIALIYHVYNCCMIFEYQEIKAHVRIETYHGMDRVLALSTEDLLRPTPASREAVQELEKVMIKMKETSCMVCLEELSLGSEATKMPCSHVFHDQCIVKWLENRFVCPLCRFELPPSP